MLWQRLPAAYQSRAGENKKLIEKIPPTFSDIKSLIEVIEKTLTTYSESYLPKITHPPSSELEVNNLISMHASFTDDLRNKYFQLRHLINQYATDVLKDCDYNDSKNIEKKDTSIRNMLRDFDKLFVEGLDTLSPARFIHFDDAYQKEFFPALIKTFTSLGNGVEIRTSELASAPPKKQACVVM